MKLLKSVLLLLVCQAAYAASPTDITADPNLTGAAPLPSLISGKTEETQTASGFDDTPPPVAAAQPSRMFGAQLFTSISAASGAGLGKSEAKRS